MCVRRLPGDTAEMIERLILSVGLVSLLFVSCSGRGDDEVFSWVNRNEPDRVEEWLKRGGTPNLRTRDGCSLLYLATGPHGGNEVLRVLVKGGADVDEGCRKYTPLMNAASWVNYEGVMILLDAGADPNLRNESGQQAIDVIGGGGGGDRQRLIREALLRGRRI